MMWRGVLVLGALAVGALGLVSEAAAQYYPPYGAPPNAYPPQVYPRAPFGRPLPPVAEDDDDDEVAAAPMPGAPGPYARPAPPGVYEARPLPDPRFARPEMQPRDPYASREPYAPRDPYAPPRPPMSIGPYGERSPAQEPYGLPPPGPYGAAPQGPYAAPPGSYNAAPPPPYGPPQYRGAPQAPATIQPQPVRPGDSRDPLLARPPTDITGSVRPNSVATLPPDDQPEEAPQALPPQFRKQVVSFQTPEPAGTIVIDTQNTFLYLVLGNGQAMRYGIGVGREGFTWAGAERVSKMTEWPDWHPPAEMIERQPYLPRFMAGGPGNPLGARALYLGKTLYRIHGTNQPSTIGKFVSSGCIRLTNDDIEDLFSRVQVGTRVVVMPGKPPVTAANQ